jgi:prevent-host-death family protein
MRRLPVSEARERIADVLGRVQRRERVILTRHGRDIAAIVPIEDLDRLRADELAHAESRVTAAYRSSWRRVTDAIHQRRA